MNLSINPSYLCNFRCNFCYLGDKLSDPKRIAISKLDELVRNVATVEPIEYVDFYGGELAILPDNYLSALFQTVEQYYSGPISVITNLSAIRPIFTRDNVILSVSYDFDAREKHELVFQNIIKFPGDIHILVLAGPDLVYRSQSQVDYMVYKLSCVSNIKTVEIKPYSTNQDNAHPVTFKDYEEFVKKWLSSTVPRKFEIMNKQHIELCIAGQVSSFSDHHVYITPSGKYGVLEFDLNDNEFFLEMDTLDEYRKWTEKEKSRVYMNGYCKECPYLGHCLSEHLREVKTLEHSCNGFRHLLDWYKNERLEDKTASHT